eukprot:superscaffoldBa00004842_g19517
MQTGGSCAAAGLQRIVLFILSGWFEKCIRCTLGMRSPACAFDVGRVTDVDSWSFARCLQLPLRSWAELPVASYQLLLLFLLCVGVCSVEK